MTTAASPPALFTVEVDLDAIAATSPRSDPGRRGPGHGGRQADAYGHGLVPRRAAQRGGAAALGVAQLAEAITARDAGIGPLLTWLYAPGADVAGALDRGIEVTISSRWQLDAVLDTAWAMAGPHRSTSRSTPGWPAVAHSRRCRSAWRLVAAVAPLVAEGVLDVRGIWQHFVYADAPDHPTVRHQQEVYTEAVAIARRAGIDPGLQHIANSAATLTNPSSYLDMVRPGVAVYGLSPVPDLGSPQDYGLREAMRVTARLALVKRVRAGQGVSYAHLWHCPRDTVIGLVPMGYADGLPRTASNGAPVQRPDGTHTPSPDGSAWTRS